MEGERAVALPTDPSHRRARDKVCERRARSHVLLDERTALQRRSHDACSDATDIGEEGATHVHALAELLALVWSLRG